MSELRSCTEPLTWSAHPARHRIAAAAAALAVIAAVSALVGVETGSTAAAAGAAGLLVLALNRFFFPSAFIIDAEGVTARYPLIRRRLQWVNVRRFVVDHRGGYLSTRSLPSRLDAWRGIHLLFDGNREQIIARIRSLIPVTPELMPSAKGAMA